MQNINLDINILCKEATVIQDYQENNGGTSIAHLLKQRQEEEIEQIMIDKLYDEDKNINIDDIINELN